MPILRHLALACGLLLCAAAAQAADVRVQGPAQAPDGSSAGSMDAGPHVVGFADGRTRAQAATPAPAAAALSPTPEPTMLWLGLIGVAALTLRRMHEVTARPRQAT